MDLSTRNIVALEQQIPFCVIVAISEMLSSQNIWGVGNDGSTLSEMLFYQYGLLHRNTCALDDVIQRGCYLCKY